MLLWAAHFFSQPVVAECMALEKAMHLAFEMVLSQVDLEGDAKGNNSRITEG